MNHHFPEIETRAKLLYPRILTSATMPEITASKKMENGIVVFWHDKGVTESESFNYGELIEMRINALDLLDNPTGYTVDVTSHRIVMKK
jgi:hypothetical protein